MTIYYLLSFKNIFLSHHKGTPCRTGILSSCTQRYTFKDHYKKYIDSTEKKTDTASKGKILTNLKKTVIS